MEELKIYENEEFGEIRTIQINGDPWFVGKDVAEALGYGDGNKKSKALANAISDHVDEDDKKLMPYEFFKGCQNGDLKNISHYGATVINESGLYSLIFGSKLESAKRFKRWVTSEVLPSIRKTGGYGAINEAVQQFMERQDKFNQMIMDRLDNKSSERSVNMRFINHAYTFDELAIIEERKKELYALVAKVAGLCGVSHAALLHQAYKAIERKLDIVLDSYKCVYHSETGKQDASMVEVIAANDWIYEKALDLFNYVIEKKSIFD